MLTRIQHFAIVSENFVREAKFYESVFGMKRSKPGSEEEQKAMFAFFNGQGYDADIAALRKELPKLKTLEQYLKANGWENAEIVPETAPREWGG